jgi:hypothetical protein
MREPDLLGLRDGVFQVPYAPPGIARVEAFVEPRVARRGVDAAAPVRTVEEAHAALAEDAARAAHEPDARAPGARCHSAIAFSVLNKK